MLGYVKIEICGFEIQKHLRKIQSTHKAKQLYTRNESIYVTVSVLERAKIIKYCNINNLIYNITDESGVIFDISKYAKRYGLYIGAIFFLILSFILSNVAFDIKIVGDVSGDCEKEIIEILNSQGIIAGKYIPFMNFVKAENELLKQSNLVSWVSIGNSGSVIVVNVDTFTGKIDSEKTRVPCNIVASRDAQIIYPSVLVGELCVTVGQPVEKGDILVSGIAESRNGNTYYRHSMGEIIAEFTETKSFYQPYQDECIEYGRVYYNKFLTFFELSIPLFTHSPNFNEYKDSESTQNFKLLGITLPIGIKTEEYVEITKTVEELSSDEAMAGLMNKVDTYEINLLSEFDIVERRVDYCITDYGISASVTYLLSGDIGIESPIYYDNKNTYNY